MRDQRGDLLQLLTGREAGELLSAAVEASGGRLLDWRPAHVEHRPGRATVSFRTTVQWHGSSVVHTETLCATAGEPLPPDVVVVGDGESRVGIWRMPHDPMLPGLPPALDRAAVSGLLGRCGLGGGPVRVRLRAYRPRRRAVVEAIGRTGRLFIKVVRPDQVRALHERHKLLTAAGVPVPRSLGWSADGLVVLTAVPGRTLRSAVRDSDGPYVDPGALTALLDRLPAELLDGPVRQSWLDKTGHYAGLIGDSAPELRRWAGDLARSIVTEGSNGPVVPVHGDFYEAQLLVDARHNVTGLLDVDTAGPGDRYDDLACLIGHLSVLAQIFPDRDAAIGGLGERCLAEFERTVDPRQLRLRVASVVMSLATGPHRVQEPGWRAATRDRLVLVERWVTSACEPSARSHSSYELNERKRHVEHA
ncbi:aminoglycoside phosphotransferase family protein [Kribbella turkmenica]|uniref:Aminoglycoside phosphotransferase family protein n=1 Tax=Kribbella turkmenica TaxID=2530375 RepID=A0A4V2YDQ2_9ACTN|nr:aminoglycoside phosphotransferase family protein [Kribbella turkmenica]TDD16266.1 aminoglycoside phosphotransferase family protein [Kribbella turkmenica]